MNELLINEAKALVAEYESRHQQQIKSGAFLVDRMITIEEAIEIIREQ